MASATPSHNPTIQNSPQELLGVIFSDLSPLELADCALVCKGWLSPAQSHLYEHIDIRRAADRMTFAARSAMLCRTLETSPRLRSLVRSLSVVSHFPSIVLPEIRCLSLQYASIPTISEFTKALVRLQTLERFSFHTNVSLAPIEHFGLLSALCDLLPLKHLRYFAPFSGLVRKPSLLIPFFETQRSPRGNRPRLQSLDLRSVSELGSFRTSLEDLDWTFHPRSPLDLTRLKSLRVSTYRAAKHIIRETSGTLENLTFTSASRILGDTESQPPITLPVLRYLCIPSETIDIALISNICCPSIERLTLIWQTVTDLDPEFMSDAESPLYLIDRCITNRSSYPMLREIAVLIAKVAPSVHCSFRGI
ncbi:hypothetical protein D9757_007102 [Collybiopsis confluens]|uniref:F-box domain-containing protein n=1 Tax=Collybiopsis confluens TaxID=2823264 RepID=A0A8H5HCK4_9AGAR|nr:hypothetical protein D9757_007102 [Collybiopsis confluens]